MPKYVSATEAKINLGSMMEWTVTESDEVIIESRGKAKAVLVSYPFYQQMMQIKEVLRREKALLELEALANRVQDKNKDLSPEKADEIAYQFVGDVVREMIAEGKISYSVDED